MATTANKKPVKKVITKKSSVESASASTKSTSKNTAKKTKSSSVRRDRRVLTPLERIRSIHFSSVFAYVALAVIGFFVLGSASSQLLLNHQARDLFANSDNVILGSANELLLNVQYRYIFIVLLLLTAMVSLLLATKLRNRYERSLSAGISGYRWLLMGVTSSLIVGFVSFISGVNDLTTLKLVCGTAVLASVLGWFSDRENADSKSPKKLAHYASIFAYVLALLPLLGSLIGTTVYGDERFGWHVYALAVAVILGFVGTLMTQNSSVKNKAKIEYTAIEQRYLRINQTVMFLVVLIVFSTFAK